MMMIMMKMMMIIMIMMMQGIVLATLLALSTWAGGHQADAR